MIVTREEFKSWMGQLFLDHPGMTDPVSALWIPEHDMQGQQCTHFVMSPVVDHRIIHDQYWSWCTQNLQGLVRCFFSDTDRDREWWGFTEYNDICIWTLKWTR